MKGDPFVRAPRSDVAGTSHRGEIFARYTDLVARLGPPTYDALREGVGVGVGEKISTEWVVRHVETRFVFTIYDYKATNIWDEEYQTVEQLRSLADPYEWDIGGHTEAKALPIATQFIAWLKQELEPLKLAAFLKLKRRR